jgi:putative hydrolase of the HAD superfamily
VTRADQVFCFDLDDTLFSEADYVEAGLRAAGREVDGVAAGASPSGEWLVELWRRTRAPDAFQRLLRAGGMAEGEWLPRLRAAYRAHVPTIRPRAGVVEALGGLCAEGARLALVSDGDLHVQRRKWEALGLPFAFAPIVFTDERGRAGWKPHPWAFERVMEAHPSAARFYYVGDNPAKDFVAPNRLGWTTVMVTDDRNVHGAAAATAGGAPQVTLDTFLAVLHLP